MFTNRPELLFLIGVVDLVSCLIAGLDGVGESGITSIIEMSSFADGSVGGSA